MNSNNDLTLTQTLSPALQEKKTDILTRYGDASNFSNLFSPIKSTVYCQHPYRCVNGTAPTLFDLKLCYSPAYPIQWLMTQLVGLSEFSGAKDKITEYQLQKLANILYTDFGHLKATEFMLFFHMVESGKFGKLDYGKFDPIRLMEMLQEFMPIRGNYIVEKEQKEREERERNHKPVPPPKALVSKIKEAYSKMGVSEAFGFNSKEQDAIN